MNIFVTGATGFIGRRVVQRLVGRGHNVRCLVRATSDLRPLQFFPIEIWRGDVSDPSSLEGGLEGIDAVIYLAGILKERRPRDTYQHIHVEGTQRVMEAAQAAGVKRFFYMSAIGAKADPRYPYFLSKWLAEDIVRDGGIPWSIIRSSVVFGEGDELMTRFASIVRHPPTGERTMAPFIPIIGSGRTLFQPIWVEDAAECIVRAATEPEYEGQQLAMGGPDQFTYEQLVDLTMDAINVHRPKLHIPVSLMRPAVALMPLVYKDPPLTPNQLRMLELDSVTDLDAVERQFGFAPAPLKDKLTYLKHQ